MSRSIINRTILSHNTATKGRSLLASQDLRKGELILQEKPIVFIPRTGELLSKSPYSFPQQLLDNTLENDEVVARYALTAYRLAMTSLVSGDVVGYWDPIKQLSFSARHQQHQVLLSQYTEQYGYVEQAIRSSLSGTDEQVNAYLNNVFPLPWYLWLTGVLHINLMGLTHGSVLMNTASMFNHDCHPNVLTHTDFWPDPDPTSHPSRDSSDSSHDSDSLDRVLSREPLSEPMVTFEAARDIKKGEELNISYIYSAEAEADEERPGDQHELVKRRHATLGEKYGFICNGSCCSEMMSNIQTKQIEDILS